MSRTGGIPGGVPGFLAQFSAQQPSAAFGALGLTVLPDALVAAGGATVGGTLGLTEIGDTLAAAGSNGATGASPPSVDNSVNGAHGLGSVLTAASSLSLTQSNEIIIALVFHNTTGGAPVAVTSVAESGGHVTFARRGSQISAHLINSPGAPYVALDVFYSGSTGSFLGPFDVSATFASNFDNAVIVVLGISGVDTSSTFDSGTVYSNSDTSAAATIPSVSGVSVTNSGTLIFEFAGFASSAAAPNDQIAAVGFTASNVLAQSGNYYSKASAQYKQLTSSQTGVTIAFNPGGANVGWVALVDTLKGISGSGPSVITGTLGVTQAAQTLVAAGTVPIFVGALTWGDCGTVIIKTNSNVDATHSGGIGSSARGSINHTSGKWYVELEVLNIPIDNDITFGVSDDSSAAGTALDTLTPFQCGATRTDGSNYINGFSASASYGIGSTPIGTRIGIAANCNTQEAFLSNNGVWCGGSDPVAGVNPRINWHGQAGIHIYPFATIYLSTVRIHGSVADQSYAAPTGYTAWGDSGAGAITGTVTVTEVADTLAAAGVVVVRGTLNVPQAAQALSAAGSVLVGGTLGLPQAAQTLAAAGSVLVVGTLGLPQAAQTLAAAGGPIVRGALAVPQAAQTLAAAGTVISGITGTLNVAQAAQALVAAGTVPLPVVAGALAAIQANQALAGAASSKVAGALAATQADETMIAAGRVLVAGALAASQAPQSILATASSKISGALNVAAAPQTITARGDAFFGTHAALAIAQADQTLRATGTSAVAIQRAKGRILASAQPRARELARSTHRVRTLRYPIRRPWDLANDDRRTWELTGRRVRTLEPA